MVTRQLGTAVAVLVMAALIAVASAAAAPKPNIIVILADDLGPGDLGAYGGTLVPTPRLDALAAQGTRFTQYYAASPICSPSRAALITGQYPARWQITSFLQTRKGNAGAEMADFLDPRAPSLPRVLQAAGYATAHIGKWHLGGGRDVTSPPKFAAYGYDEGVGTYESPEPHPDITSTNWIWADQDPVKRWNRTAFLVDRTLDFLDRHTGTPVFVNVWLDDPHTPWVPDASSDRKETPGNLRRVLAEMDRQVGRLLDGLEARGLATNTLVIFASDNGALPTFNGVRSAPYRGHKLALYEGGIRVPFIVRWPGQVPAGRVDARSVVIAQDLLPTLSGVAGAALPRDQRLNGRNVLQAWRGRPLPARGPIFWEYGRNDDFFKFGPDRSPSLAVRRGDWKLLINPDGSRAELYDLTTDSTESRNRAAEKPDVVKALSGLVMAWRASWPGGR